MPSMRRLALLCALLIIFDQVTKSWALSALDGGRTIDIIWTLRFALGFNSGMAFSQGEGLGVVIGLVAVGVVVVMWRSMMKATSAMTAYGFSFIIGGALGNVVDRLFRQDKWMRGHVVDFIDLQWWPVFNVADSAIFVGASLLVLGLYFEYRAEKALEVNHES
jgi:signal peptidase II